MLPATISPAISEVEHITAYAFDATGTIVLSPKQEELWERWNVADNYIHKKKIDTAVIAALVKKFKYSTASARRDLQNARTVFNSKPRTDKEYNRNFFIEWSKEILRKCEKKGDYRAFGSNVANVIKLGHFDRETVESIDWNALEAHKIEPTYDPSLLGFTPVPNLDEKIKDIMIKLKISDAQTVEPIANG